MHQKTALTIGNFDAVHCGHQTIIRRARQLVGADGRVVVLSFYPHPMMHLNPDRVPALIEPMDQRERRLLESGADRVIALDPTPELLGMSPGAFVDQMIDRYRPDVFVEGTDFHFGSKRAGNITLLQELCSVQGVDVEVVHPVVTTMTDQTEVIASSTMTRWLLAHGRVRDAAFMLGRMHELVGDVVRGDQLGRTIGFPTANLRTGSLLPVDGVYAGIATMPDGGSCIAAINIGSRPTVQGLERRAEAHLLNYDGSVWIPAAHEPEYGWGCTIGLMSWIREEMRFGSVDQLRDQLVRDIQRIVPIVQRNLPDGAPVRSTNEVP